MVRAGESDLGLGIGALVILALKVGNMGSFGTPESYTVYAEFENIGGLKPGAPVSMAGVSLPRFA